MKRFFKKIDGVVLKDLWLESKLYGLVGKLDAVVKVGDEIYPIDVKFSKFSSISYAWKMQLTVYSVLVEESSRKRLRKLLFTFYLKKF
ncbi:MAG: Dna2/Cas4 domain-containing protein [Archaeoglobaceae archaeon]|nr:Dna2/Cas4 domain-containing protein [Archaeoglobaceae archaeon]MCX8152405.1 Dna2/Cas4 domain-containing protein [Archaeoglobaceae archaeon]MDW8013745.1 Dna2/Cas4 domain-containing protein [Archaeoglobaceae archaeon]